ncbi:endonuclease/exonuclease/phosphatase family protein [Hypericibacter sp.]|uniref:endonuclease/exonuclease/phosphatase family protein n=1 Tax=Hypericibacter sp. TaxID=2705401 RepID=UPI003D6D8C25
MLLASYNIQYSLGQDGRYDMARCLSAVRGADVICLQEVERNWHRSGMVDQPALIQELLPDRYAAYGSPFDVDASSHDELGRLINRRRQFGQMTLSRWPILAARAHILPKLDTGRRFNMVTGALETVIATPGGPLRLFNIHLSDASMDERLMQIEHLMGLLRHSSREGGVWNGVESDPSHWQTENPPPSPADAILLGDFNTEPDSAEYEAITRGTAASGGQADAAGNPHAFVDSWIAAGHQAKRGITYRRNPAQLAEWDQRIDYCFLPLAWAPRLVSARIDAEAIGSDHQPIWVELKG